jgi:hypothetical protein
MTTKTTKSAKDTKPAKKATAAVKAAKPEARPSQITHDMIATRAYHIWLGSGRPQGQDGAIWLQAEAELRKGSARSTF